MNAVNARSFIAVALIAALAPPLAAQSKPTYEQFLSAAYPSELVSAKKADRIAWLAYDRGLRNVYTAAGPAFKPVRLTKFLDDDGVILSELEISDDGSVVTFVRGSEPNRQGWLANPSSDPNGPERAIWAARTDGSGAWRLGDGAGQTLSPDGKSVVFVNEGQIFRLATSTHASSADKNEQPFIKEWGRQAQPRWSPDGSKLAYVSVRDNHALIAVYDMKRRKVYYVGPSVDTDLSPTWSPDGTQLAFVRRPGTPFGQQAQQGDGSIGNPGGPGRGGRGGGGRTGGRGGRGGVQQAGGARGIDGLYRAAFTGGYTISLMVGDIAGCPTAAGTCDAHEFWHNQPGDRTFPNVGAITWAGKAVLFQQEPEEWIRIYSIAVDGGASAPVELTPGAGQVESTGLSRDGTTLFYATNAGDIDRRHIWKVPTAGGTAVQISAGDEIEMYPAPLGSGKQLAVLTSGATRPLGVGIISTDAGSSTATSARKIIFPTLPKDFPVTAQVAPTAVVLKADDGFEFHNQLFLPKDIKPGEHRPAMIFVHGGPIRQMLLGYHYMDFYAQAYAINEWLASQGYVVMSVNYRSGVGYGKSFRTAPNTGGRGNAEYKDVIAAGKWLAARPDVDPSRVGIWGLSYGGVLTAQALARNSDVFSAGIDMAGVHLWGNSLDTADVSYKSSAISAIDTWKSPVLVWQGDDDRNVEFSQSIGLVDLLRAHNVDYELIVVPDDTHETLMHKRWLYLYGRMEDFLRRKLLEKPTHEASR
ncbi:MAG: S9 family peptidase [Gemmatimonadaceae bacterium]